MSVVDRVKKLVALAGTEGTPEEEARSAALIACRLIVANKLEVFETDPSGVTRTQTIRQEVYVNGVRVSPNSTGFPGGFDVNDIFNSFFRASGGAPRPPPTTCKCGKAVSKRGGDECDWCINRRRVAEQEESDLQRRRAEREKK